MNTKNIEATFVCDISQDLALGNLISFSCQSNRQIIFAIAKKTLDYTTHKPGGIFPKTQSEAGQDYSIYLVNDDHSTLLCEVSNEPFNIYSAQLLADDTLLLSCSRSRYTDENNYEKNGRIYSLDGQFQGEVLLGDGVEDVQVTSEGIIWTSYFDEGVFGNFGWTDPVGRKGLIAWDKSGEKKYEYKPSQGMDAIHDCYALNVESNDTTWFYYYSEFQLAKIKDYKVAGYWDIPIHGSHCFAVYGDFALLAGGYDDGNSLFLLKLGEDHKAEILYKIELANISTIDRLTARGDTLYILSEGSIYKLELPLLLSNITSANNI